MINNIEMEYFKWLCGRITRKSSYNKLLMSLYEAPFIWIMRRDANRESDGRSLRRDYAIEINDPAIELYLNKNRPGSSVLEMMIALALRCERDYIGQLNGEYTAEFLFWSMIDSMHLSDMTDSKYDGLYVMDRIDILLDRSYKPNGDGGLFTIKEKNADVRDLEIWKQMTWYIYELLNQK